MNKPCQKIYPNTSKLLLAIILIGLLVCCSKKRTSSSYSNAREVKLTKYESIIGIKPDTLVNTSIITYDGMSRHLFIYDEARRQVLELNSMNDIIHTYGRAGRGPEEFLKVNNIFVTKRYLYVIDPAQYRISRFTLNGEFNSLVNYGNKALSHGSPPPPPSALVPRAKDINNQPAVTLNGNVLLPIDHQVGKNKEALYKLMKWKGPQISSLGEVPKGSTFIIDYDEYQSAVKNRIVPAFYKSHAFPINDQANPQEYFVIYSAFPKIAKYDTSGEKHWENIVPQTPELDSLLIHFYNMSAKMRGQDRIELKTYVSGVNSRDGYLYLALGKYRNSSNDLWIHMFNTEGKLIRRYKLVSKDVELVPVFDIDFTGNRIFVVTESAEIRAYSF